MSAKKANLLRKPYDSELAYFKKNPNVAGMATEDNRIIINPYSSISAKAKDVVYKNEEARLFMRNSKNRPNFKLSNEQKQQFKDYGSEQDVRETIAARILSGDKSAQAANLDQVAYVSQLKKQMGQ